MAQSQKANSPASSAGLNPQSPEEKQALQFLVAANQIASEIEVWRDRVRRAKTRGQRREFEDSLGESAERLCNMLALIELQLTKNVRATFRDSLAVGIGGIRQKLAEMGTGIMLKKIEAISEQASTARDASAYPIGLAAKLDKNYEDVMENLRLFGGTEILDETQQTLVESTRSTIDELRNRDEQVGLIKDFEGTTVDDDEVQFGKNEEPFEPSA